VPYVATEDCASEDITTIGAASAVGPGNGELSLSELEEDEEELVVVLDASIAPEDNGFPLKEHMPRLVGKRFD